jgi:hypothetical protein
MGLLVLHAVQFFDVFLSLLAGVVQTSISEYRLTYDYLTDRVLAVSERFRCHLAGIHPAQISL